MACDLVTTELAACNSGIKKIEDPLRLLRLIAQLSCEIADAGTGGSPSLPLNSVQFNNAGAFGGSADFTFNDATNVLTLVGTINTDTINTTLSIVAGGTVQAAFNLVGASDASGLYLGVANDVILNRDAAGVFAQRNGVTAQAFRVYRTFTNAANYERLALQSAAGQFIVACETAGTGTDDIDLTLTPAGTGLVRFGTHNAIGILLVTGFIPIRDAGGTIRNVAIVS